MLRLIIDKIVYSLFGLTEGTNSAEVLHFFLYDSLKIMLLLFVMISVISFFRSYIPASKVKLWLTSKKAWGNFMASCFGAITPFCSCSSIPLFLSFIKAAIPLGVTFSFLITAPMINEYLVVLMIGFFGWKITLLYVISGLIIGTLGGIILGKMNLERYIVDGFVPKDSAALEEQAFKNLKERIIFGINEAVGIIKKLWIWILIAVGIGAFIHNYVPRETVQQVISKTGVFSVPLAVLLGMPMYGSCAAIVPVAVVLFRKGVPLGTALAFMMATSALSLPEAVILRRAMKLKLILLFFGIVTAGIIFTGYLFNMLQAALI